MFTGLIEAVRPIKQAKQSSGHLQLRVDLGRLAEGSRPGDSICLSGVCLTISALAGAEASFDVVPETQRTSTLGEYRPGRPVNVERALRAGDRFGGHLVQGHVDGIGRVAQIERTSGNYMVWIAAAPELLRLMIPKGSVAVDGVSLTIVAVRRDRFSVALIPTTRAATTLGNCRVGERVNLEADLIGKWINRRLDDILGAEAGTLSGEKLRRQGFA